MSSAQLCECKAAQTLRSQSRSLKSGAGSAGRLETGPADSSAGPRNGASQQGRDFIGALTWPLIAASKRAGRSLITLPLIVFSELREGRAGR